MRLENASPFAFLVLNAVVFFLFRGGQARAGPDIAASRTTKLKTFFELATCVAHVPHFPWVVNRVLWKKENYKLKVPRLNATMYFHLFIVREERNQKHYGKNPTSFYNKMQLLSGISAFISSKHWCGGSQTSNLSLILHLDMTADLRGLCCSKQPMGHLAVDEVWPANYKRKSVTSRYAVSNYKMFANLEFWFQTINGNRCLLREQSAAHRSRKGKQQSTYVIFKTKASSVW